MAAQAIFRLLPQLPLEVEEIVIGLLPLNDIACTFRLLSKAAAARFSGPQCTTVRLSQPVPHHAFAHHWGPASGAYRSLIYARKLELLCLTAAVGDLPNLEVAVANAGCVLTGKVMEAAAAAGHLHVCQWLRQEGCPWGSALPAAAGAGRRAACEWLVDRDCPPSGAVYSAFRGGHVGLMEWLQQLRGPEAAVGYWLDTYDLLAAAAENFDLATLQRLHREWLGQQVQPQQPGFGAHGDEEDEVVMQRVNILVMAACSPTADWQSKVEWLEGQGYPRTSTACSSAASLPDAVDRLRWLWQRGYPVDGSAVSAAATQGSVPALQYLLAEVRVRLESWQTMPTWQAAQRGHLAALQVLHAYGCPMGEDAVGIAATNGHLAVVVWLVETLGLATAGLGAAAARSGNMELLAWLHEHGCDWRAASLTGVSCEEALEWLVECGCPVLADGEPYVVAARCGDLATLRCLRRLGCPVSSTTVFERCIRGRPAVPALHWLVEQGCPVNWDRALKAARVLEALNPMPEVLAWVEEQRRRRHGAVQG